jgi:hypothetical protein
LDEQNTIEGKPCVSLGESDFKHNYVIAGFSTKADADALVAHLRTMPFIELAFQD